MQKESKVRVAFLVFELQEHGKTKVNMRKRKERTRRRVMAHNMYKLLLMMMIILAIFTLAMLIEVLSTFYFSNQLSKLTNRNGSDSET